MVIRMVLEANLQKNQLMSPVILHKHKIHSWVGQIVEICGKMNLMLLLPKRLL